MPARELQSLPRLQDPWSRLRVVRRRLRRLRERHPSRGRGAQITVAVGIDVKDIQSPDMGGLRNC